MRTNQVNRVIDHPLTTFGTLVVNVNNALSQQTLTHSSQTIYQVYIYLILNPQSKVESQRDSYNKILVNSLKVRQLTKQNVTQGTEQSCSVKHDSNLSSRNSLLLPSLTLPLPQKIMKRLGATILLGAAQAGSKMRSM